MQGKMEKHMLIEGHTYDPAAAEVVEALVEYHRFRPEFQPKLVPVRVVRM